MRTAVLNFMKKSKAHSAILGAIFIFLLGNVLFLAAQYSYENVTPDHFWVDYDSITSTGELIDGEIDMRSYAIIPRGGDIRWVDRLYCDFPPAGGFRLYSSFTDNADLMPDTSFDASPWFYKGGLPPEGTVCYIESSATLTTPLGVEKKDFTISNTFPIGG